jgi:predicted transporter
VAKVSNEKGQAIIEYVIMLAVVLGMAGILVFGVKNTRDKLWKHIVCVVSAPCPTCQATESAKQILPQGGNCPR